MKAENLRRELWRTRNETVAPLPSGIYETADEASDEPPSYDTIAPRKSMDLNGMDGRVGRTGSERTSSSLAEQTVTERRTGIDHEGRVAMGDHTLERS